jgi:CubicO group peptidase (beta-lactamase class C family)
LRARAFPGAAVAVGTRDAVLHLRGFGRLTYDPAAAGASGETIYDLASLTKVVVTTTMAMMLVDEGRLDLQTPVAALVPEMTGGSRDRVTLWHLLTHSSGLPGWVPLYRDTVGKDAFVRAIAALELEREPGAATVYSDVGFILLGAALEAVAGLALDAFGEKRVLGPLAMADTRYLPPAEWRPRIAPTEDDSWRGRVVHGEVHDENAFAMGGVAGHAGLFGTAADLARFAGMIAAGGLSQGRPLVSADTLRAFSKPCGIPGSSYALGWDMPSGPSSTAGRLLSRRSIGHLGYAGTSLWIDPDRGLYVILLSNRVHPTRANDQMRAVRAGLADAVVEALGG